MSCYVHLNGNIGFYFFGVDGFYGHSPSIHVVNYASNISSDGVVGLDYNTIDWNSCGRNSPETDSDVHVWMSDETGYVNFNNIKNGIFKVSYGKMALRVVIDHCLRMAHLGKILQISPFIYMMEETAVMDFMLEEELHVPTGALRVLIMV